jgi:outer membrane receptor protein involved in Fe transport
LTHPQTVAIHNISSGTGTETLLMVDGMRFPVQGFGTCYIDPSIIPQLAIERIDVLADGASATYGSDAVAGVINEVLRRGFEGAISEVQYGRSTDIGGPSYLASQLYGRKWDSGDITVTYEYYHSDPIHGPARPYYTLNFAPFGFNDVRPIGSSMPGVVSTGALATDPTLSKLGFSAKSGTNACTNCFSIPAGTGSNESRGQWNWPHCSGQRLHRELDDAPGKQGREQSARPGAVYGHSAGAGSQRSGCHIRSESVWPCVVFCRGVLFQPPFS